MKGKFLQASLRVAEEHQSKVTLSRRSSSIVAGHRRRAANLSEKLKRPIAGPNYTPDQVSSFILQSLGAPCKYCGAKLTVDNFDWDHPVPIDRGGEFTLENSEVITASCNKQKGGLTSLEFQLLYDLLSQFPPEGKRDVLRRLAAGGRMFR